MAECWLSRCRPPDQIPGPRAPLQTGRPLYGVITGLKRIQSEKVLPSFAGRGILMAGGTFGGANTCMYCGVVVVGIRTGLRHAHNPRKRLQPSERAKRRNPARYVVATESNSPKRLTIESCIRGAQKKRQLEVQKSQSDKLPHLYERVSFGFSR